MTKGAEPNKVGTYEVIDEKGKIVETFRLKATADNWVIDKNAKFGSTLTIREANSDSNSIKLQEVKQNE